MHIIRGKGGFSVHIDEGEMEMEEEGIKIMVSFHRMTCIVNIIYDKSDTVVSRFVEWYKSKNDNIVISEIYDDDKIFLTVIDNGEFSYYGAGVPNIWQVSPVFGS